MLLPSSVSIWKIILKIQLRYLLKSPIQFVFNFGDRFCLGIYILWYSLGESDFLNTQYGKDLRLVVKYANT